MSLELCRQVSAEHPELDRINLGSTCFQHTTYLIAKLRAAGHVAHYIGKTAGEGQYTPPGFTPRTVAGLDGKPYVITGVSHDAIYCDGKQVDTLAQANDSDTPIGMVAIPVWNDIPQQFWRVNNPPLTLDVAPAPTPQAPVIDAYPGDAVFDAVGAVLFADYAEAGRGPDSQMGRWFGRVIYDWLAKNEPTLAASIAKHRKEWRAILGLP